MPAISLNHRPITGSSGINTIHLPWPLVKLQPVDFPHKLGICERLFGRSLARHGICWVTTGAGIPWKLDLTNPTHRWIVYGKYESAAFLNWAYGFLPPDGIIVDSGANIGQMLLYLSQRVPEGKVLAFEPGKIQADWLQECLEHFPELPVELIRAGLATSSQTLFLNNTGPENVHGAWSQVSETKGEQIQVISLRDALVERDISLVHLWKLDVEGYEIPALQGAEELLKTHRILALYVELAGNNGPRIRDYLSGFGYVCHLFDSRGKLFQPAQLPEHTCGLFLPEADGD